MISRLTILVICVCSMNATLLAKEISAPEDAPLIQILIVKAIDQKAGLVIFERESDKVKQTTIQNGRLTTEVSYVPVKTAFSLKDGEAMTADGKEIEDADLWKRLKVGKPVIVLSPDAADGEEGKEIRRLFKNDTVLLVGGVEDVPVPKDAAKKR